MILPLLPTKGDAPLPSLQGLPLATAGGEEGDFAALLKGGTALPQLPAEAIFALPAVTTGTGDPGTGEGPARGLLAELLAAAGQADEALAEVPGDEPPPPPLPLPLPQASEQEIVEQQAAEPLFPAAAQEDAAPAELPEDLGRAGQPPLSVLPAAIQIAPQVVPQIVPKAELPSETPLEATSDSAPAVSPEIEAEVPPSTATGEAAAQAAAVAAALAAPATAPQTTGAPAAATPIRPEPAAQGGGQPGAEPEADSQEQQPRSATPRESAAARSGEAATPALDLRQREAAPGDANRQRPLHAEPQSAQSEQRPPQPVKAAARPAPEAPAAPPAAQPAAPAARFAESLRALQTAAAAAGIAGERAAGVSAPGGEGASSPSNELLGTRPAAFGTTADARPAQSLAQPLPTTLPDQVGLRIQRAVVEGQQRMTVQLHPAELGRIDVRLEFGTDGTLRALITAERPEALELLQRDARGLERALNDAGLKTDGQSLNFDLREQAQQRERAEQQRGEQSGRGERQADKNGGEQPQDEHRGAGSHRGLVNLSV